jgi:hypothetical protein
MMSVPAAILAIVIALVASIGGGAIGGVAIAGKDLGRELAATMGGFYGPLAGVGGVFLGIIVVAIVR